MSQITEKKPRLTTSAMIASIAEDGQETRSAPFGHALVKLAEQRPEVVGMTADLSKYTDLHIFAQAYPERFFQMGMAEQLLMGAAGEWQKRGLFPSPRHMLSLPPVEPTILFIRLSPKSIST